MNLKQRLLAYQRAFVDDPRRFKVWVAARQTGKSTAVAFEAASLAFKRRRTDVLLVSAAWRQSMELLERVRFWLEVIKTACGDDVVGRASSDEVHLAGGSRIKSLPAAPDTIRGFTGHIFLDEFAFHRHSDAIWAAVYPIVTRGFKLAVTSTPNGCLNMFYRLWERKDPAWGRHMTTIHQAIADGLSVDLEALRAGVPDPTTWAQEYECAFVDQATSFLPYDLIAAAESPDAGRPELAGKGPFYLGADIGRHEDLTVYWLLEAAGDVFWTRQVVVLRRAGFAEQDLALSRMVDAFQPRRVCMDKSGLGEKTVEDAQARYGRTRVEGVHFTNPVKQDLAGTLRRLLEDRRLRLPVDPAVREDLHGVKRRITSTGAVRYDADRTSAGHGDRFWALALACQAADQPDPRPAVISGGRRPNASMEGF